MFIDGCFATDCQRSNDLIFSCDGYDGDRFSRFKAAKVYSLGFWLGTDVIVDIGFSCRHYFTG